MNGPQWNTIQPPVINTSIFPLNKPSTCSILPPPQYTPTATQESGFIEKILTSYGFIRCNERKARIFFHFSEYNGDIKYLKIGDVVQFSVKNHPKTGKPLACDILPLALLPNPEPVEVLTEEKFRGSLVKEATSSLHNGTLGAHCDGMLTYQNCGESFFVPYSVSDLCDCNLKLNPGDQVLFYIATDRIGSIRARQVELVVPTQPQSHIPQPIITQPLSPTRQPLSPTRQPLQSLLPTAQSNSNYSMNGPVTTAQSTINASAPPFEPQHLKSLVTAPALSSTAQSISSPTLHNTAQNTPHIGIICSLKETFGFIEKFEGGKIFFHFSEFNGNIDVVKVGCRVEFDVQYRNNKEVAIHIQPISEPGSENHSSPNKITVPLNRPLSSTDQRQRNYPPGKLTSKVENGRDEDTSLGVGDHVNDRSRHIGDSRSFNADHPTMRSRSISDTQKDRRMSRGETNLNQRYLGMIVTMESSYGFIEYLDRDVLIYFHVSNCVKGDNFPNVDSFVEFSVHDDSSQPGRKMAVQVKNICDTVGDVYTVYPEKYIGTVNVVAGSGKAAAAVKLSDEGKIVFDYNSSINSIVYNYVEVIDLKTIPSQGDKIQFQIAEHRQTKEWKATSVKLMIQSQKRSSQLRSQGFVATLKENFAFIETADHEREIFFHYSAYDGDPTELDLADELEFTITTKNSKVSAENVRRIPKGSIVSETVQYDRGILSGKVVRPMRIVNPEQEEYYGLVQAVDEGEEPSGPVYPYGITSLADKRDYLQVGDPVKFQISISKITEKERAVNVAAKRSYVRSKVNSVKGQFGFLNHEVDSGKKLFFHMTEVHDGVNVNVGDEVEFVVVKNQRNGKYSACSLRKISNTQRPDRLLNRMKSIHEAKPSFVIIRQPKGPDGTTGFNHLRSVSVQD